MYGTQYILVCAIIFYTMIFYTIILHVLHPYKGVLCGAYYLVHMN